MGFWCTFGIFMTQSICNVSESNYNSKHLNKYKYTYIYIYIFITHCFSSSGCICDIVAASISFYFSGRQKPIHTILNGLSACPHLTSILSLDRSLSLCVFLVCPSMNLTEVLLIRPGRSVLINTPTTSHVIQYMRLLNKGVALYLCLSVLMSVCMHIGTYLHGACMHHYMHMQIMSMHIVYSILLHIYCLLHTDA